MANAWTLVCFLMVGVNHLLLGTAWMLLHHAPKTHHRITGCSHGVVALLRIVRVYYVVDHSAACAHSTLQLQPYTDIAGVCCPWTIEEQPSSGVAGSLLLLLHCSLAFLLVVAMPLVL